MEYLEKYAPKLKYIVDVVSQSPGKIVIYNHYIHNTVGILTIRELLKQNGFAEYDLTTGNVKDVQADTMCNWCKKKKNDHEEYDNKKQYGAKNHNFIPMAFVCFSGENKQQYMQR